MIGKSGDSLEIYHGQPCFVAARGRWYRGTLVFPDGERQTWKQIAERYITATVIWKFRNGHAMRKSMRVYEDFLGVIAYGKRAACLNPPRAIQALLIG